MAASITQCSEPHPDHMCVCGGGGGLGGSHHYLTRSLELQRTSDWHGPAATAVVSPPPTTPPPTTPPPANLLFKERPLAAHIDCGSACCVGAVYAYVWPPERCWWHAYRCMSFSYAATVAAANWPLTVSLLSLPSLRRQACYVFLLAPGWCVGASFARRLGKVGLASLLGLSSCLLLPAREVPSGTSLAHRCLRFKMWYACSKLQPVANPRS